MDPEKKANNEFEFDTITIDSGKTGQEYQYDYRYGSESVDISGLNNAFNLGQGLTIGSGANITGGAIGSGIYTTTTTGTGGYNWNIVSTPTTVTQGGQLSLRGEKADIEINGKSMSDWMAKVEQRLNILVPNPELEREWDELRRLGERYRKLEKKCKEKAEIWKQLKKMPAPGPDQF